MSTLTPLDPDEVKRAWESAVSFVRAADLHLMDDPILLEGVERTRTLPNEEQVPADQQPVWKLTLSVPVPATAASAAFLRNVSLGTGEPLVDRVERTFYLEPKDFGVLVMSNGYG